MSEAKCTNQGEKKRHGTGAKPATLPRCNLSSLHGVRREMARVYRDMRFRDLDCAKGTKLVFVLSQIGKMLEASDLERRIAALEDKSHGKT